MRIGAGIRLEAPTTAPALTDCWKAVVKCSKNHAQQSTKQLLPTEKSVVWRSGKTKVPKSFTECDQCLDQTLSSNVVAGLFATSEGRILIQFEETPRRVSI